MRVLMNSDFCCIVIIQTAKDLLARTGIEEGMNQVVLEAEDRARLLGAWSLYNEAAERYKVASSVYDVMRDGSMAVISNQIVYGSIPTAALETFTEQLTPVADGLQGSEEVAHSEYQTAKTAVIAAYVDIFGEAARVIVEAFFLARVISPYGEEADQATLDATQATLDALSGERLN
jgi:hypothetical protein